MVQRPSSPTSLLWAHQLKREHNHLLERVKGLEATRDKYDARLKAAEESNQAIRQSVSDITHLKARVAAIEEDDQDVRNWVEKLDTERRVRMSEVDSKLTTLSRKVASFEAENIRIDEENERYAPRHGEVLQRLDAIEAAQEKAARSAEKLGRKDNPADVRMLSRRLELLETRRNESGAMMRAINDRTTALERDHRELVIQMVQLMEYMKTPHTRFATRLQLAPRISPNAPGEVEGLHSSSPAIQVPRSPLVEKLARNGESRNLERQNANTAAPDVPHLRRSARVMPTSGVDKLASHLLQQAETQCSSSAAAMRSESPTELANSRRKRKAMPAEDMRQTRNAAKRIKPPADSVVPSRRQQIEQAQHQQSDRPARTEQSTAVTVQPFEEPFPCRSKAARPTTPKPRRKRRQIPQPYDLAPQEDMLDH